MKNPTDETQNSKQPPKKRRHSLNDRHQKARLLSWYLHELRNIADTEPSKLIPCGLATAKIMLVLNQIHENDAEEKLKLLEAEIGRLAIRVEQVEYERSPTVMAISQTRR